MNPDVRQFEGRNLLGLMLSQCIDAVSSLLPEPDGMYTDEQPRDQAVLIRLANGKLTLSGSEHFNNTYGDTCTLSLPVMHSEGETDDTNGSVVNSALLHRLGMYASTIVGTQSVTVTLRGPTEAVTIGSETAAGVSYLGVVMPISPDMTRTIHLVQLDVCAVAAA